MTSKPFVTSKQFIPPLYDVFKFSYTCQVINIICNYYCMIYSDLHMTLYQYTFQFKIRFFFLKKKKKQTQTVCVKIIIQILVLHNLVV